MKTLMEDSHRSSLRSPVSYSAGGKIARGKSSGDRSHKAPAAAPCFFMACCPSGQDVTDTLSEITADPPLEEAFDKVIVHKPVGKRIADAKPSKTSTNASQKAISSHRSQRVVTEQYWNRLPQKQHPTLCSSGLAHLFSCLSEPVRRGWRRYERSQATEPFHDLAEIVLECAAAEDQMTLDSLSPEHRSIVLGVGCDRSVDVKAVGRQHQQHFFQAVLPEWQRLAWVSRTHVEFSWHPRSHSLRLTRFSRSPVSLDGQSLSIGETVPVRNNARLVFHSPTTSELPVLVFNIHLRSLETLRLEGHHPTAFFAPGVAAMSRGPSELRGAVRSASSTTRLPSSVPECPSSRSRSSVPWSLQDSGRTCKASEKAASKDLHLFELLQSHGQPALSKLLDDKLGHPSLGKLFDDRHCQHGFLDQAIKVEPSLESYISRQSCQDPRESEGTCAV